MRTFEIIILLVNLPLIYWLLFRSNRFPSWARFLPIFGVGIIIIHLITEGYRWQMFPIYLLTFIFLLLVVIKHYPRSKQYFIKSKISSIIIGIISIILFSLSAVLGTLLPIFSLPELTGSYPVGTASYHWIDETREELNTDDDTDKREIMVQFWYPATYVENPEPNYYWQDYDEIIGSELAKNQKLPEFIFSHFNRIKTNAMLEAPLSDRQLIFPVVIYSHGNHCARSWATNQMEELASHGYIVIALDRTYNAMATVFPDGRAEYYNSTLKYIGWDRLSDSVKNGITDRSIKLAGYYSNPDGTYDSVSFRDTLLNKAIREITITDISFVMNQLEVLNAKNNGSIFENRINLEKIGAMGFSTGGGITEDICERDKRIKVIITLDSGTPDKTDKQRPILCVLSEFSKQGINPKMDNLKGIKGQYEGKKINVDFVLIKGTFHNIFTDGPLYSPLKQVTNSGPLDPVYAHHIINTFIVSFFDKHLKENEDISISAVAKNFSEVYYDSVKNK